MAVSSSNPFFVIILLALLAGVVYLNFAIKKRRRDAMSAMAARLGLQPWPDDITPRGISLNTPFEMWTTLFNIYEGVLNGHQISILDFRKQQEKSGWSRTIIAVKTTDMTYSHKTFELELKQVGDWQIIYSPVGFFRGSKLMDISEIENVVNAITH